MKAAIVALTASSLLSSAFALHPRHAAFHEKRADDVQQPLQYPCCKTVVTVTVYPTSTSTPGNAAAQVVAAPTANAKKPSTPAAASAAPAVQVPQVVAGGSKNEGSGGLGSPVIVNGKKWAMTYTPYNSGGGCKDAASVLSDLQQIKSKGFTTVRLYGTDCSTLQNAASGAVSIGLKVILGIFIKNDGVEAARPQIGEIINWGNAGNWGSVVMVVAGNEAITGHGISAAALAGFISSVKSAMVSAGQAGIPVTTTETVDGFGANKAVLCPVVDVVGTNVHPFFDSKILAAGAGAFVALLLEQVKNFCPGKPYYNLETGWPNGGGSNGASIASPDAQKAAIQSIVETVGDRSVIFSFSDDAWKPAGIEQHFGCSNWF